LKRAIRRAAALAAALLLLSSCAQDPAESPKPEKEAAPVLEVEIRAAGNRFEYVAPDDIGAGVVKMNVKNSTDYFLQAQLIRIDEQHSLDEALQVITTEETVPIPEWLSAPGGVVYVHSGKTKATTLKLAEGTYYLIDYDTLGESVESSVESPAPGASATPAVDPERRLSELGLTKKLVVTEGEGEGAFPKAEATVVAREYEFEVPELKAGTNSIEFRNEGKQLHHLIAFPLLPGKTFADVAAFTGEGPPPFDFASADGAAIADGGHSQVTELDLKPGTYAFMCFATDRAGGPPHVENGMIAEVQIS
jgi:hypothetical protein